jgi:hypothetical protein
MGKKVKENNGAADLHEAPEPGTLKRSETIICAEGSSVVQSTHTESKCEEEPRPEQKKRRKNVGVDDDDHVGPTRVGAEKVEEKDGAVDPHEEIGVVQSTRTESKCKEEPEQKKRRKNVGVVDDHVGPTPTFGDHAPCAKSPEVGTGPVLGPAEMKVGETRGPPEPSTLRRLFNEFKQRPPAQTNSICAEGSSVVQSDSVDSHQATQAPPPQHHFTRAQVEHIFHQLQQPLVTPSVGAEKENDDAEINA